MPFCFVSSLASYTYLFVPISISAGLTSGLYLARGPGFTDLCRRVDGTGSRGLVTAPAFWNTLPIGVRFLLYLKHLFI